MFWGINLINKTPVSVVMEGDIRVRKAVRIDLKTNYNDTMRVFATTSNGNRMAICSIKQDDTDVSLDILFQKGERVVFEMDPHFQEFRGVAPPSLHLTGHYDVPDPILAGLANGMKSVLDKLESIHRVTIDTKTVLNKMDNKMDDINNLLSKLLSTDTVAGKRTTQKQTVVKAFNVTFEVNAADDAEETGGNS